MPRPPHARDRVLDAFEALLLSEGAQGATVEATARAAGVSKGGLLYHFASKDALIEALLHRALELTDAEMQEISDSPAGPIAAFMRISTTTGTPVDRALIAATRLAQQGNAAASDTLRRVRERWEQALRAHTRDQAALDLVILVSDGLYFSSALVDGAVPAPGMTDAALDALIALVERAAHEVPPAE